MKQLIKKIGNTLELYRCPETGIAWIDKKESRQMMISYYAAHPQLSAKANMPFMIEKGKWSPHARQVRTNGIIYDISQGLARNKYEKMAAEHCRCSGVH